MALEAKVYINFRVCPPNVYFPRTSFPLLPLLPGAILVTKELLSRDYKYWDPLPGSITFDLTTLQTTSMII